MQSCESRCVRIPVGPLAYSARTLPVAAHRRGHRGAVALAVAGGLCETVDAGRRGRVRGVLVGVPLPLCSCSVIPVGLGLKKQGASDGATVGFLISTPQTGVDSVLMTASMLGWPFALFKVAAATVTGLVGGWLTDATSAPPKPALDLPILEPAPAPRHVSHGGGIRADDSADGVALAGGRRAHLCGD